jgi:hypothetical protein
LYEFPYTVENAAIVEKESEQVVTVLRAPQLKEDLKIKTTQVVTYKPSPFALVLQTKNTEADKAVSAMITLGGYLTSKYQVNEIGKETFYAETKPYSKYLFLGLISGELTALVFSLILTYLKRY